MRLDEGYKAGRANGVFSGNFGSGRNLRGVEVVFELWKARWR